MVVLFRNNCSVQIYEFSTSKGLPRKSLMQTLRLNLRHVPIHEISLCEQRYRLAKALQLRRKLLIARYDSARAEFLQETVNELEILVREAQDYRRLEDERVAHEQYREELHEKIDAYAAVKEAETMRTEQERANERAQAQRREENARKKEARRREKTKERIRAHEQQKEFLQLRQSAEEEEALREIQERIRRLILENKPHVERRYELLAAKEQRRRDKDRQAMAEAEQRQEKLRRLVESVRLKRTSATFVTCFCADSLSRENHQREGRLDVYHR